MINKSRKSSFAKNRAEELGLDVWDEFVIPPFFDSLDLREALKPRVITGGRGCGKTMLVRYLSHHSAFSKKRLDFPDNELDHIGLYWRVDTQFVHVLRKRGIDETKWENIFEHCVAVNIGLEIVASLRSIAHSNIRSLDIDELMDCRFENLSSYGDDYSGDIDQLDKTLHKCISELEFWISNIGKIREPLFLPGRRFVMDIIYHIQATYTQLSNSTFYVYVDEYENLLTYQQRIINTYLKHSETPLVFNIACKKYGISTNETVGAESIQDIHDYRQFNLEEALEKYFPVFASEVLQMNLSRFNASKPMIDVELLRDQERVEERMTPEYKQKILLPIRKMFPKRDMSELASMVFQDTNMKRRLEKSIGEALQARGSKIPVSEFIREINPEASIICPALLSRERMSPETVLDELKALGNGKDNKFSGPTDWIHNFFIGSLLSLYISMSKTCPIYCGFDTFCKIARGNLRHLLEMCYASLGSSIESKEISGVIAAPDAQVAAARRTAAEFLKEVRSCGTRGLQLYAFTLRLGMIFRIAHMNVKLSEPEQSHFAIDEELTDDTTQFIQEAVKWGVLFEEKQTKVKEPKDATPFEYILNPIYAPFFNISYRKKHKLALRMTDFQTLYSGNDEEYKQLRNELIEKLKINTDAQTLLDFVEFQR